MTTLSELGLSTYEERAYRALAATGPAPARTVADRSDVPDGRIYDVLNGLDRRGLVESRSGDPRRYVAVDPADAIDRLLAERLDELDARRERYERLAESARSRVAPTPPVDGNVWLTGFGDEDATTLLAEQVAAADDRFAITFGPPYDAASIAAYESEIDVFFEHAPPDLTVDVLCGRSMAETTSAVLGDRLDAAPSIRVRTVPSVTVSFEVVDGAEVVFEVPHPFDAGDRFGFVEVRDATVARRVERAFDAAWDRAEPIE